MKVLLLAALVSVAVAMPNRGQVREPVNINPVLIDAEPVDITPAVIPEPVDISPVLIPAPADITPIVVPEPIDISPILVPEPIDTSPILVEEPIIDGPALVEEPADPSPAAPLVQIIVNINTAADSAAVEIAPTPIQVVEAAPTPVQVVDTTPVPVEPVVIGTPILPEPAVILPEELN